MPDVQRDGDTWAFAWPEHGIAVGVERLRERSDTLKAEVTVESSMAGRVVGPNTVDLLSARSQAEFANACAKRVNGLGEDVWRSIVVYACARVAKDYREPTPTLVLADVEDSGPVQYLVPALVPRSETTVLYGDGEAAKSLLALRLGFSVATGQDVPWGHRVDTGGVLYLDWETNAATVASRLKRISRAMCTPVPDNLYYRQCFRSLADELPHIREEISRKRVVLVIVDSIGFAASGALIEDETARTAMNALRMMTPATRLVVAHVSKGSADSAGPVKPFGSAFFWNGMRSGIEVRRSEDQPSERIIDIGLYHRKSNDGRHARPIGLSVLFDQEYDGTILFEEAEMNDVPDLAARAPLSLRIRALLKQGAMATRDMADELDAKEDSVYRTLKRMDGVVMLEGGRGRGNASQWGLSS
jgi:AAA domain-containing protein